MDERKVEDGVGFCEHDGNSYGEDNDAIKDCIHTDQQMLGCLYVT